MKSIVIINLLTTAASASAITSDLNNGRKNAGLRGWRELKGRNQNGRGPPNKPDVAGNDMLATEDSVGNMMSMNLQNMEVLQNEDEGQEDKHAKNQRVKKLKREHNGRHGPSVETTEPEDGMSEVMMMRRANHDKKKKEHNKMKKHGVSGTPDISSFVDAQEEEDAAPEADAAEEVINASAAVMDAWESTPSVVSTALAPTDPSFLDSLSTEATMTTTFATTMEEEAVVSTAFMLAPTDPLTLDSLSTEGTMTIAFATTMAEEAVVSTAFMLAPTDPSSLDSLSTEATMTSTFATTMEESATSTTAAAEEEPVVVLHTDAPGEEPVITTTELIAGNNMLAPRVGEILQNEDEKQDKHAKNQRGDVLQNKDEGQEDKHAKNQRGEVLQNEDEGQDKHAKNQRGEVLQNEDEGQDRHTKNQRAKKSKREHNKMKKHVVSGTPDISPVVDAQEEEDAAPEADVAEEENNEPVAALDGWEPTPSPSAKLLADVFTTLSPTVAVETVVSTTLAPTDPSTLASLSTEATTTTTFATTTEESATSTTTVAEEEPVITTVEPTAPELTECPPQYDITKTTYTSGELIEMEERIFQCRIGDGEGLEDMYVVYCNEPTWHDSFLASSPYAKDMWNDAWVLLGACAPVLLEEVMEDEIAALEELENGRN